MFTSMLNKQAKPGSGAFSLTGQPSACGTAREVGTFCHRLPADLMVANPDHRKIAEKKWNVTRWYHQPNRESAYYEDP